MELMRVREAGYAVDDEEFEEGLRCVGAPVFDHRGHVVASISTAAPVFRLRKDQLPHVARLVIAAAQGLSEDLGYQDPTVSKRETGWRDWPLAARKAAGRSRPGRISQCDIPVVAVKPVDYNIQARFNSIQRSSLCGD